MVKNKEEELKELERTENDLEINLEELESLIIEGADARIPVLIEYPKRDKKTGTVTYEKYTANLKPLTNTEVNNARRAAAKITNTTLELELLRRGLFTKDDNPFPFKLIRLMNNGVVNGLVEQLLDVSGVKLDPEEQKAYAREVMGF